MKGIDVSSYQKRPDWQKVKTAGIQFAILRCHQKTGIDSSFNYNYENAKRNGILVGVYKYSYAKTTKEVRAEADAVLEVLNGRELDFPVYFDLEDDSLKSLSNSTIEKLAESFLKKIQNAGYKVGIYVNKDWYNNKITQTLKDKYDFWIASIPANDNGSMVERLKPSYAKMWQYSFAGKVPGIQGDVDMDFYDGIPDVLAPAEYVEDTVGTTAEDILKIMRSWIGLSRANGTHKVIIDTYNSYLPHPRGYAVSYTDDYCDTTVSAAFVKAGAVDIIGGIECGVEEHVRKFTQEGIWIEDGTITPRVGDIITYNWDKASQPNDGWSDHIGIVESVGTTFFTTIEGNMSGGVVGRRTVNIGDGYIRGFARPKYAQKSSSGEVVKTLKTIDELANEVLEGKWGNGVERTTKLIEAGYDPRLVQARVNEILAPKVATSEPVKEKEEVSSGDLSREPKWRGRVTADKLNVRTWAGTIYPRIKSFPSLSKDNLIYVCDTVKDANGADWYFIKIANQFYGFVSAQYIERA